MKLHRYLAAAILAASAALAAPALAERGHGGKHEMRGEGMLRGLDLTEAQRDQIFRIRHEQAPAARERMKAQHAAREELRKAAADPSADAGRIRSLADAMGKAHADAAVARIETQRKVLTVLTPEQRQRLEQQRSQRRESHPRHRS